jgi:hypothetical protein
MVETCGYDYAGLVPCFDGSNDSVIVFMFMLNRCLARNSLDRPFLGSWRDLLGIRTALPVVHLLMRDGCAYFFM